MLFYKWAGYRRFFKYGRPVLNLIEQRLVKKNSAQQNKFPIIFLIGCPRSGTTFLYQYITHFLDVAFINNFMNLSRENPVLGFYLSGKILGNNPHGSFESEFGDTSGSGLRAPNESLFWYKWLPTDKHYIEPSGLSREQKKEISSVVSSLINIAEKPLVIKNLSFSLRLKLIKDLFPSSKIIYIKRDPVYIAQSIFLARKKMSIPPNKIWSIKPQNYPEIEPMNELDLIVNQVYSIEKQINKDMALFDENKAMALMYEEFDPHSGKFIDTLSSFIGIGTRDGAKGIENVQFKPGNFRKVDKNLFDQIKEKIGSMNWDFN